MSRSVYRLIPMPGRPLGLVCAWVPIPSARWHRGHRMRPNTSSTMTMAIGNAASSARNQAGKEEGHNRAPDNSVPLIKVFAHRFHGARFYSLWSAAHCSRQIMALHRLVEDYSAMGDSNCPARLDSVEDTSGSERRVSTRSCLSPASGVRQANLSARAAGV